MKITRRVRYYTDTLGDGTHVLVAYHPAAPWCIGFGATYEEADLRLRRAAKDAGLTPQQITGEMDNG